MKATEQNDKLKCAIILSIALHCVLIAVLVWSSIHQLQKPNVNVVEDSSSIDAVIVDLGEVAQQYDRHQQRDKQADHKKTLKEQHITSQEAAKAQQHLQAEQQKREEKTARKAQIQQKESEAAVFKQQTAEAKQVSAETAQQAKVNIKQAVSPNKVAAESVKQSKEVNDLLGRLTDAKNMLKVGGALAKKQTGNNVAEIDAYKAIINNAIKNKFYDYTSYVGKVCDLYIKLGPDGKLVSVSASSGDPELCQAAISATKAAYIPRPPNSQVYKTFKNTTLKFSPQ